MSKQWEPQLSPAMRQHRALTSQHTVKGEEFTDKLTKWSMCQKKGHHHGETPILPNRIMVYV